MCICLFSSDPIDDLKIMHPPVVKTNSPFTAYAFVTAPMGLPGKPDILGPVTYTWSYADKVRSFDFHFGFGEYAICGLRNHR